MINLYVGITDYDWYQFLSGIPDLAEVNFWQPGGKTRFRALRAGELFLFKLHAPRNFVVGYGVFAHESILPVSIAWEAFGTANGAASLAEMRSRIGFYRRETTDPRIDYMIGCRMLEQPTFFSEKDWIPAPASWAPNIVSGRTYDTTEEDGRRLWDAIAERMPVGPLQGLSESRYGAPTLIHPRLGQGSFRVAVTDVYGRQCAITSEKTLPILDAAHIRPYAAGGGHEITNGLLLRTDIHRLFDLGYVTISDDGRFEVGRRLRDDFENGRHYYAMRGQLLTLPDDTRHRPDRDALRWHQTNRFLG